MPPLGDPFGGPLELLEISLQAGPAILGAGSNHDKHFKFLPRRLIIGDEGGGEKRIAEKVFPDELFGVFDFALFGESPKENGKTLLSAQLFSRFLRKSDQNIPVVLGGVGAADFHVVASAEKIQNLFLVIPLDPDLEKIGVGQALLAVYPEGVRRRTVAIDFNDHRSLVVPDIFGHLEIFEIIGQIKIGGPIDVVI